MKLATIELIAELKPHPNADRLELATVLGWQTIVRKGEFTAGEKIVFVPIDTILPKAPWSEFLADKKNPDKPIRLKTIKLRGQFSQGLALPLTVLPECVRTWHPGADVGGELGIKKFEKEIPAQLSGIAKGNFPRHLAPKTDEDNALSNPSLVDEVLQYPVTITQKLDGSSCTIIVKDGAIEHVCSRNLSLVESETNSFWRAARKLKLADFSGVIQGELMGPGIQGNQLELLEPELYVFQIRDDVGWCAQAELDGLCERLGAKAVPVIESYEILHLTLDMLQFLADAQVLPNGKPAEGIVVRPTEPRDYVGEGRPLGFKLINRNYGE
jgi:RNA ligase (TIGR02306 family)